MKGHRHNWLSFERGHASANVNARIRAEGRIPRKEKSYNGCRQVHGIVGQFIDDIELETVALSSAVIRMKIREQPPGSYRVSFD